MTTMHQDRPISLPASDPATETYWNAAKQGVLRLRRCTACREPHWYPRPLCPFCLADTEWIDASGTGTIYSVSVTRRAGPIPYAIAYVTLDEGVTMLTNIVDCDLDSLRIGQRVKVCFKSVDGGGAAAVNPPPDPPEKPVLRLPTMGGSLPTHLFERTLHVPLIVFPMANHDDNQHAKDENLRIQNLWDGIDAFAAIMTRMDAKWPRVVP